MAPTDFVLFWRDTNTKKSNPLYDTLDKLIAAKPLQVLLFDAFNSLSAIEEIPQINISNDPHYDPTSDPIIEKQYNGNYGRKVQLTIKSDANQGTWRDKLNDFLNNIPLEPAYHENGIFGIFHPVLTDKIFRVDPVDAYGFTIDEAPKSHVSGSEAMTIVLTLTLGGNQKTAGP